MCRAHPVLLLLLTVAVSGADDHTAVAALRQALAQPQGTNAALLELPAARAPLPRFWSLQPHAPDAPEIGFFPAFAAALRDPDTAQFVGDLQTQLRSTHPICIDHPPLQVITERAILDPVSGLVAARVLVRVDGATFDRAPAAFVNPSFQSFLGLDFTQPIVRLPLSRDVTWEIVWQPGAITALPNTLTQPAEARHHPRGIYFVWDHALDNDHLDAAFASLHHALATGATSHLAPRPLLQNPLIQLMHAQRTQAQIIMRIFMLSDVAMNIQIESFATPALQALQSRDATSSGWLHLVANKPVTIDLLMRGTPTNDAP